MDLNIPSAARRTLLLAIASIPLISACAPRPPGRDTSSSSPQARLASLESGSGGRLGVAALSTADGTQLRHRADERFPFCSTAKMLVASAILHRSMREGALLQRRVKYTAGELVKHSPVTERHVADGMTAAELCAATIQYSDNTAANLLVNLLGGPSSVTAFARSIGDDEFRLDRREPELNSAIPGDPRDTTTPAAMARSLQRLALGDTLGPSRREQLQGWMLGNTTGDARIRAGVPADWRVGDKTGTGDYGTSNDIGVLWRPAKPPIVVALYFTQHEKEAKPSDDVLAAATRIVVEAFG